MRVKQHMEIMIRKVQAGGNLFGCSVTKLLQVHHLWGHGSKHPACPEDNCSCTDTVKAYKADCGSANLEVASTVNCMPFYNEEIV